MKTTLWKSSEEKIAISRLHIGYRGLMHAFIRKQEQQPQYIPYFVKKFSKNVEL